MRSPVNSQQIKNGRTQFAPTVRRRLHRIVRNSLWLSLTHCAIPPFPQKSRSARLFGCKRPLDGSLSLPTFADLYIAFSRELSFISDNLTAAASHRPTTLSLVFVYKKTAVIGQITTVLTIKKIQTKGDVLLY